jgi:hypothetical protein
MSDVAKPKQVPEYDSNPFTLSFRGFGLFVDYAKGVFIAMLIFGFFGFFMNILSYIPDTSSTNSPSSSDGFAGLNDTSFNWAVAGGIAALILGVVVVSMAVGLLISAAYKGFVAAGANAAIERRKITAGEAFSEMGSRFSTLFSAEISTTLRIIGGYFLLFVPGIRAQLRYQSTPFIIMADKKITASDSVKLSKELYRNHLMEALGISTVGGIIPLIGSTISASGMALSVQQLKAYKAQSLATPKTHILNYIGLIIFGAIFFFALFVGIIIGFASN